MDYDQLREILVNTESLYSLWQSTGMSEDEFIRGNGGLIEETEKARLKKESERQRQRRFFESQKAKGRKSLTCIVSAETYDHLCKLRDRSIQSGEKKSLGQILDSLVNSDKPVIVEAQTEIPAPAQKNSKVKKELITTDDKNKILDLVGAFRLDQKTWVQVAEKLNELGIRTPKGRLWTGINAERFYSRNSASQ